RAFEGIANDWQVQYRRIGTPSPRPSFTDRGGTILIHDLSRDSVLAALQVSAQKWKTFEVSGSRQFKRLCAELAAEHGFHISNPELQKHIDAERERRRHPKPQEQAQAS